MSSLSQSSPDQPSAAATARHIDRTPWQLLGLWLALRVLTSAWAALVSPLRPLTEREHLIALWPPSAPLDKWLERVLLAPWERWDVGYYVWIITRGYRADDGTAQFHPLLSWLATPLAWLTGHPTLALLLVSSIAGALLLIVFERLALLDLDPEAARVSTLSFICWPAAFILFAPYSEALFLLWAVLCLLWARQRSWWAAGLAGGLAILTRQQGLFLVLPLAWEVWEASNRDLRQAFAAWRNWLAVGFVPLGMLIWVVYRAVVLGDFNPDLGNPHTLIYSVLISPSANQVVPIQTFMWPWQALWLALLKLFNAPDADIIVNLVCGALFLAYLILAWRNLSISYRIYTVAIALVSFSYHTGPQHPYMGLPRHLLLAFPVFVGLGPVLRRAWARLAMAGSGLFGMFFLLLLYVIETWIP